MRRCTNTACNTMHFPRTDPAVIMLVTDGERALLGRNKNFPLPGMYSTLAGFVEPGESLEDAVAREVREETGLELDDLQFAMVQDCIDSGEFVTPAHFLLLNYVALTRPGEVKLNDEAQRYMWVPPEEALAMNLNTPTRVLLELAMTRRR